MVRLNYSRFTKNFFLNHYSLKQAYRPLNAQIEVTLHCNARCVFCSIWKKDFQKELKEELTTEQMKRIIDDIDRLGVNLISFTGGEPTLRKDLPEIIEYTADKGIMTGIATNGYYLFDMIKEGKLNKLEWVMVSVDWPDDRHDKYRGIKVFDRAVKGIRAAVKVKKEVVVSMVVTKENISVMEEMCKFTGKLGCMIEMLPCEDLIREQENTAHVVEEIESFIPDLHQYAEEIRRLEMIYPNLITDSVSASIIEAGGFGNQNLLHCAVASAYLFIKANGEIVFPCKIHPVLKVNAKKMSLYDAYYSYEAKKIMDMQDHFSFCKGCRFGCAIATTIPTRWAPLYQKYMKAFFNGNFF
jgi:MoaA/NifB/PqqE/SkfB family radical SAM enzyme